MKKYDMWELSQWAGNQSYLALSNFRQRFQQTNNTSVPNRQVLQRKFICISCYTHATNECSLRCKTWHTALILSPETLRASIKCAVQKLKSLQ